MSYRVSMSPKAASLLAAAPPPIRATVRRRLQAANKARGAGAKGSQTRLVFIFDEPLLLLEVGPYHVFYEMEASTRTVRVRHITGPAQENAPAAGRARKPRNLLRPRSKASSL